jgi:uncharacterized protein
MTASDPHRITTRDGLRAVYKEPIPGAVAKEIGRIDPHCRAMIGLSPFLCMATMSAEGRADVSPRGGEPGFVHVLEDGRLAIPDRPGNNRLDSLTNLIEQPSVALIFLIPGFEDALRVNGKATITTDPDLMQRFLVDDKPPRAVVLIEVEEAQHHCAKAIKRAGLWDAEAQVDRASFATPGQILRDHLAIETPVETIDAFVAADARDNLY